MAKYSQPSFQVIKKALTSAALYEAEFIRAHNHIKKDDMDEYTKEAVEQSKRDLADFKLMLKQRCGPI